MVVSLVRVGPPSMLDRLRCDGGLQQVIRFGHKPHPPRRALTSS